MASASVFAINQSCALETYSASARGFRFHYFVEVGPGWFNWYGKKNIEGCIKSLYKLPSDIDKLLEMISGQQPSAPDALEGEHLFATERLLLVLALGFSRHSKDLTGKKLQLAPFGHVNETEVEALLWRNSGFLAVEGERVTSSQPIAWLRILR